MRFSRCPSHKISLGSAAAAPAKPGSKPKYDYTSEKLHFESAPHRGDLATNVVLGATLLWLPLTVASVGRAAFVKYRFTDRRVSVITNAPWKREIPSAMAPHANHTFAAVLLLHCKCSSGPHVARQGLYEKHILERLMAHMRHIFRITAAPSGDLLRSCGHCIL